MILFLTLLYIYNVLEVIQLRQSDKQLQSLQ